MKRSLLLLLCALAPLGFWADSALAHARFDHSMPSPGEVLSASPSRVDIFVVQDLRKVTGADQITVTGLDGSRVDDGATVVDDNNRRHFSVGLLPHLPQGRYLVNFKTISDEDGETDHGQFAFYIGVQPTVQQKAEDQQLALTAQAKDEAKINSSHTGLYIAIAAVAAISLIVASVLLTRRRRG